MMDLVSSTGYPETGVAAGRGNLDFLTTKRTANLMRKDDVWHEGQSLVVLKIGTLRQEVMSATHYSPGLGT